MNNKGRVRLKGRILAYLTGRCVAESILAEELGKPTALIKDLLKELHQEGKIMVIIETRYKRDPLWKP